MKSNHTPGPWKVDSFNDRTGGYLVADTIEPNICEMASSLPPETVRANAELIASAPTLLKQRDELLAALKALLSEFNSRTAMIETCDMDDDELKAVEMAEKAIASVEKGGE